MGKIVKLSKAVNENGIIVPHGKLVLSYGFSEEINEKIRRNLPKDYNLCLCDNETDIFAIPCACWFANPETMADKELEVLMEEQAEEKEE
jgi:hypothetical protein